MKILELVVVFWVMVVSAAVMIPGLSERAFWQDLERQAVRADLIEGEQD